MCPEQKVESLHVQVQKTAPALSMFFFLNLEYFMQLGGFKKVCERIPLIPPKDLILLKHMILPLSQCREHIQASLLVELAGSIKEATFAKLQEANTGPLLANEKSLSHDMVLLLRKTLCTLAPEDEVEKDIDQFKLELALKGFESNNLGRRLRSLGIISGAISRAMPAKSEKDKILTQFIRKAGLTAQRQTVQEENKPEAPKPIEPKFILDWLRETDFVRKLLDSKSAHPEEIKQGISLFRFLAVHNLLPDDVIEQIWSMQCSLESTSRSKQPSLIPFFFLKSLAGAIKPADQDFESLRYLASLTAIGSEKDSTKQEWFGLETLFTLAIETCVDASDLVVTAAYDQLIRLIKLDILAPRRHYLLEKSAAALQSGCSAPPCLQLIKETLQSLPKKRKNNLLPGKKPLGLKSTIEALNQQFQVIPSILKGLLLYKDVAREVPIEKLGEGKKIERFSHLDHIRIRLDFLQFFTSNSGLQLQTDQTEQLWNSLVVDSLLAGERFQCYKWLEEATDTWISLSAAQSLFESSLCTIPAEEVDQEVFLLFQSHFLVLNTKSGKLKPFQSRMAGTLVVKHVVNHEQQSEKPLLGYDSLWNVALYCPCDSISRQAIERLCLLHQILPSESLKPRYRSLREEFVSRCLDYLESAISVEPPQLTIVERCISVMKVSSLLA